MACFEEWLSACRAWPAARVLTGLVAGIIAAGAAAAADVRGAGATFPAPAYQAWAEKYRLETGVQVDYAPIGSSAGLEAIEHRQVDFGATDLPLTPSELARLKLLQFPAVIGGVVPVLNIAGIAPGQLRLTGEVLALIYLGRLRRWGDPAIADLNPGLALPDTNINVVHRSDGSGTTRLWSEYLASTSPEWRAAIPVANALKWPVGVAEEGNEGVASAVQRTRFSIGYVAFAFALQHGLSYASLRNHDGRYVLPGKLAFEDAASGAAGCAGGALAESLVDRPGPGSWPIVTASYILVPNESEARQRSAKVQGFFKWALQQPAGVVGDLGYAAAPALVPCLPQ